MAIRMSVTMSSDLTQWTRDVEKAMSRAISEGVKAAADGAKLELRQQIAAAGIKSVVGNMIGSRVFATDRQGRPNPTASIFSRGPQADVILTAFSRGPVIVPKHGRFLAIPTGFNRASGRKAGNNVLVSPAQLIASRQSFVLPARDGKGIKVWFATVNAGSARGRNNRAMPRAFAAGLLSLGSGRRQRVEEYLKRGAAPMFVLVPRAKLPKALDPEAVARKWGEALPDLIERGMPEGI